MIYKRTLFPSIQKHLFSSAITVLTGMRRTGKTTLVKQLLDDLPHQNYLYLDLQRPDYQDLFRYKNFDAILNAFQTLGLHAEQPMVVALDEIQLIPESVGAIKYLFDHYGIKFILTGSSSFYLKNLFTESLAGRKKIFELTPLDFGEFLSFHSMPSGKDNWHTDQFDTFAYERLTGFYEEYIQFGGFPQVVLAQTAEEKKDILNDIITSYINIDVKSLADFQDERNIYALMKLLASRSGTRLDYTKLARLTGLSRPTIMNYVSFLEKTYIISLVPVYTHSTDREIVKAQKVYFCDTGMANILAELSGGSQFENTVYNQLARLSEVQYYALKTGHEIDFITDKTTAYETKETATKDDYYDLAKLADSAGLSRYALISRYKSPTWEKSVWGGAIY